MTERIEPERWNQIKEIFSEATNRPEAERQKFLDTACSGDAELQSELRRLLTAFENPCGIINKPLAEALGGNHAPCAMFQEGERLLDRFEIVRLIARGGMGEVYEALDLTLREMVAVKTLGTLGYPEQAESQTFELFKREVRRSRRIISPYVCRVYDIFTEDSSQEGGRTRNVTFLTMELLNGETLADRLAKVGHLPSQVARAFLAQLADGLEAAHRAGVLHRDLKPRNIILCPQADGTERAVITDFGLAYRPSSAGIQISSIELMAGAGTPAYMAPEQVEGKPLTFAADVYSLGLIAFEMVTGRLPFEGDSSQAVAVRRLTTVPRSPRDFNKELPRNWEEAILDCLKLDPAARPQKPGDLPRALLDKKIVMSRKIGLTLLVAAIICVVLGLSVLVTSTYKNRLSGRLTKDAVAIMPFQSVAGSQPTDYFGEGFTEELIASLARVSKLRVIAADSSRQLARIGLQPEQIGKMLGVGEVVAGSIQRQNGRLRLTAKLLAASDGIQLWSGNYEVNETDLADLREQLAAALALALKRGQVQVVADRGPMPNLDAHELYWMGRYHFRNRTTEGMTRAAEFFNRATTLDPNYASAYSGLADVYSVMAEWNTIPPSEALARAKAAALKAVALNSHLAEGWVSLAQATSLFDRDFVSAEKEFRTALQLEPGLVTAHQWYSYMLLKELRFDESMQHALRAVELDPVSVATNQNLAVLFHYKREDDAMVRQYRKVLEIEPKHTFAHFMIAETLARKGLESEAFRELEYNSAGVRQSALGLRALGEISAIFGKKEQAQEMIGRLIAMRPYGGVSSSYVAGIYSMIGKKDEAFEWLEKAYSEQDAFLSLLQVYPAFDSLREDGRYRPMVERLGFRRRTAQDSDRARPFSGANRAIQGH